MKFLERLLGHKLTPQEAVDLIRTKYPDLIVVSCKDYKTDYLVTAYKTPEDMDPFYLVDKRGGFIRGYTIALNPSRYYDTDDLDYE